MIWDRFLPSRSPWPKHPKPVQRNPSHSYKWPSMKIKSKVDGLNLAKVDFGGQEFVPTANGLRALYVWQEATKSVQNQRELCGIYPWYASVNLHVQHRRIVQDCNSYTQPCESIKMSIYIYIYTYLYSILKPSKALPSWLKLRLKPSAWKWDPGLLCRCLGSETPKPWHAMYGICSCPDATRSPS